MMARWSQGRRSLLTLHATHRINESFVVRKLTKRIVFQRVRQRFSRLLITITLQPDEIA
jgi:hypothetical protein